jgi:RimJ/RimL family protein N-acetyltransferase
MTVRLRLIEPDDLHLFYEWNRDPEGVYMAAFTTVDPNDRAVFDAYWARITADPKVLIRTIEVDGVAVGSVCSFPDFGDPEVSYWIDRARWGRGIATAALREFLPLVRERPLFARAASDNLGSRRVLEKCGFREVSRETNFAEGRGVEVEETVFRLD